MCEPANKHHQLQVLQVGWSGSRGKEFIYVSDLQIMFITTASIIIDFFYLLNRKTINLSYEFEHRGMLVNSALVCTAEPACGGGGWFHSSPQQ